MYDLLNELWFLPRELVSDGYDAALARLAEIVAMKIHQVPSGTPVWTWTVPEKWTLDEAWLETLDGTRLVDAAQHPLYVVSYSLPFEGEVSREELFQHLHTHPRLPDAIPFVFKYYQRDWGLCCSQELKDSLTDERYRVVIRTRFEPGALKIGEVIIPGEREECFVLAAHLCHPAQANDDLTGVLVGLDAARALLAGPKPRYTIRVLFFPETIGSVAYLSQHEDLIPSMRGGLFLEMLGNDAPLALQQSFQPESQCDRSLVSAFRGVAPEGYVGPYRTIIDNDERQFNAPGVRVPMLSLSRVVAPHLPESRFAPYPEYHSSRDTPAIVTQQRLEAARDAVLALVRAFDSNRYVVNQFKGEVFASGHGIWIDYRLNPEGHSNLFQIMERCDGEHTLADIAMELGLAYDVVWNIVGRFAQKRLVEFSDFPQPTAPRR
jgi:aminopeptidase-like protein